MLPLTLAQTDTELTIRKIGGNPELQQHMKSLGFNVGGNITLISRLGDNVIVKVKDSRVAISADMAQRIMV